MVLEMETQLQDLETEWFRYVRWARGQGLYPEFNEKFFDWLEGAGNE